MRKRNKEHEREYNRGWYLRNRKKALAYSREYRLRSPEHVARHKEKTLRNQAKIREYIQREKTRPCADCKVQYNPWVMDFDHREGEVKSFGLGVALSKSMEKIKAEIAKCDVVCANCHRERTQKRQAWKRQKNVSSPKTEQYDKQLPLPVTGY